MGESETGALVTILVSDSRFHAVLKRAALKRASARLLKEWNLSLSAYSTFDPIALILDLR